MKKFVGCVNGKSFDNEKDFNLAAEEAIKTNDGNLAISSYYAYGFDSEDEDKEKEAIDDDKYVSTNEYFLGDRKPDNVSLIDPSKINWIGYTNVEYNVPPMLEERLKVARNKENIKNSINYHVDNLVNSIKKYRGDVKELEKKIDELQEELNEKQSLMLDQEGRRKYYNHLLDILETPEQIEESCCDEEKCCKKECDCNEKVNIRELLNIDENTSLFGILRQLGILK